MAYPNFYKNVFPWFSMDLKDFLYYFYIIEKMSDIAIAEMIESRTGIKFSRAAINKWHRITGIPSRNPHERFRLAIDKARFNHKDVANKIDYKARSKRIDYSVIQKKRLGRLSGRNYLCSESAIDLRKLLNSKGKTTEDLAKFLNISVFCVKSWCSKRTKIHPIYWKAIEQFIGLPHRQTFKFDSKGFSFYSMAANKINVTTNTIYAWVRGRNRPRLDNVISLKRFLKPALFILMTKNKLCWAPFMV